MNGNGNGNYNEEQHHVISPVAVEIFQRGDIKWGKVLGYDGRDVYEYQKQFKHDFWLPPSLAATNPLFANEFDSFVRILKCFYERKCIVLFQALFDSTLNSNVSSIY